MNPEKEPQFNIEQEFNIEQPDSKMEMSENIGYKQKEIIRKQGESQPAYLERAGELVTQLIKQSETDKFFDPCRAQENDLPAEALKLIEDIMVKAKDKSSTVSPDSFNNAAVIKSIEQSIKYHQAPIRNDLNNSFAFDKTQRNRKFFEIQPGKGDAKRETYWNTLFFPYNTKATRAFAKEFFDDKIIVLLGGGRSRIKEELKENKISPREVVNIDPFVENPESEADTVISISASDEHLIDKMREYGIEKADEIWAEFSVPAYIDSPKEIQQLIQNIDQLLAEDGSARIWPIKVKESGDESDSLARKTAFIESLKNLNIKTNKYEFILYEAAGRHGLIIHKLKNFEFDKKKLVDNRKNKYEKKGNFKKKIS